MTEQNPDILIGHAERDEAVGLLKTAYAEGRLTGTELETRLDQAMTARTRADLHPVLADLPQPPPTPADPSASSEPSPTLARRILFGLGTAVRHVFCCAPASHTSHTSHTSRPSHTSR